MSVDNSAEFPVSAEVLSRKSWVAYVGLLVFTFFLFIVGAAIMSGFKHGFIILLVILLPFLVIGFLRIKSVKLYVNETGVWLFSGVFPWDKGSMGVKWRDLDEAVIYLGFKSWLFRSHTLRIGHRFTKASEINVENMTGGVATTTRINEIHQQLISDGKLV